MFPVYNKRSATGFLSLAILMFCFMNGNAQKGSATHSTTAHATTKKTNSVHHNSGTTTAKRNGPPSTNRPQNRAATTPMQRSTPVANTAKYSYQPDKGNGDQAIPQPLPLEGNNNPVHVNTVNQVTAPSTLVTGKTNRAQPEYTNNTFWKEQRIVHSTRARRQQRHCGCAGDIKFVNTTDDTLDIYIAYLTPSRVPTVEGAILPRMNISRLIPNFRINPHDSTAFRGSCQGGLQYEAINHKQKGVPRDHMVELQGTVRMSCMNKVVMLKEEEQDPNQ